MIQWSKKNDPGPLLERIESHTVRAPDGNILYGIDSFVLTQFLRALLDSWNPSVSSTTTKEAILGQALTSQAKKGALTNKEELLAEINAAQEAYLRKPLIEYVVTTTISAKVGAVLFSRFFYTRKINGTKIVFSSKPFKRFDRAAPLAQAAEQGLPLEPEDYTFARVFVVAREPQVAIENALANLDILRAIWNLSENYGHTTFHFGGWRQAYNTIVGGPLTTLHEAKSGFTFEGTWVSGSFGSPVQKSVDVSNRLDHLRKQENLLRRNLRLSPFSERLTSLLRDYCHSLDLRDFDNAFISLWHVLERLCGLEPSDKHTEIVERVSWLFQNREYHRLVLNILMEHRHDAVHRGTDIPGVDYLLSSIRFYVEYTLSFMLSNSLKPKDFYEIRDILKLTVQNDRLSYEQMIRKKAFRFRNPK